VPNLTPSVLIQVNTMIRLIAVSLTVKFSKGKKILNRENDFNPGKNSGIEIMLFIDCEKTYASEDIAAV
jgi:hypothetical protein